MASAPSLDGAAAFSLSLWQKSEGNTFSRSRIIPNVSQEASPQHVFGVSKKTLTALQTPCKAKWRFSSDAQEAELVNLQKACTPCDAGGSPPSLSGPHHAGHIHAKPFPGTRAGITKPFEPLFNAGDRAIEPSGIAGKREPAYFCVAEAVQDSHLSSAGCNDAWAANDDSESYIGSQLVDIEDYNHTGDGYTLQNQGHRDHHDGSSFQNQGHRDHHEGSSMQNQGHRDHHDVSSLQNQGHRDASFYSDGQMAESMGGVHGTLFSVDIEDAFAKSSMNANESIDSPCELVAVRAPTHLAPMCLQDSLREITCYLESLGVNCAKLFQDEPAVKSCTLKHIKALVSALESYSFEWKDVGRVFRICPQVLLLDPGKDLEVATSFLFNEAGLSPNYFCKVIRRCPQLLVADIDTHLRPTLSFLRRLGFVRMGHAVANNPALLSYDLESRILPRLRLLESWGFTFKEAAAMVVRFPAFFNYGKDENLQCKYDYLVGEIKAGKKDLLAFPHYFGYGLESRIRPRHQCLAKLNVPLSIQAMLTLSDEEFNAKFASVDGAWTKRRQMEMGISSMEAKLHGPNLDSWMSTTIENFKTQDLVAGRSCKLSRDVWKLVSHSS